MLWLICDECEEQTHLWTVAHVSVDLTEVPTLVLAAIGQNLATPSPSTTHRLVGRGQADRSQAQRAARVRDR